MRNLALCAPLTPSPTGERGEHFRASTQMYFLPPKSQSDSGCCQLEGKQALFVSRNCNICNSFGRFCRAGNGEPTKQNLQKPFSRISARVNGCRDELSEAKAASANAHLAWRDANAAPAPENEAGGQEFHVLVCDAEPNQDF